MFVGRRSIRLNRRRGTASAAPHTTRLLLASSIATVMALSACTSAQDVLNPSDIKQQSIAQSPRQPETAALPPQAAAPPPAGAAISGQARLQIAPIVGATVEAAAPLTERLTVRARARGIGIAGSADTSATYVLKGYFSTVSEGRETTVVYVWDVYDRTGNRVHRINGQQAGGSGGGGWAAVSAQTMQGIADKTVDQLAAWLGSRPG